MMAVRAFRSTPPVVKPRRPQSNGHFVGLQHRCSFGNSKPQLQLHNWRGRELRGRQSMTRFKFWSQGDSACGFWDLVFFSGACIQRFHDSHCSVCPQVSYSKRLHSSLYLGPGSSDTADWPTEVLKISRSTRMNNETVATTQGHIDNKLMTCDNKVRNGYLRCNWVPGSSSKKQKWQTRAMVAHHPPVCRAYQGMVAKPKERLLCCIKFYDG